MAVSNISLTSSMRSNLLSLQNTQKMFDTTQNRLSTGKKVNSAMDNPSNFFTAQSLTARANDLSSLMDSIGQAVSTLETADKGITTLTKYVEQAKSLANSARDTANVKSSATSGVKFDVANVKTQKVVDAVGGVSAGDSFTIRLGKSTEMVGEVNLNETQKLSDLGLSAGTNDLEIIVDGQKFTVELQAGSGTSYDASTKKMTMGLDTTVEDFMSNVVENIGRKKISAELVDGRMTIKTLDNTAISIRSDSTQVDGATIAKSDLDAMVKAASVGAKGATAYGTLTTASTKAEALELLSGIMTDMQEAKTAATATGNTSAVVAATLDTAITNLNTQITAVKALGDTQTVDDLTGNGGDAIAIVATSATAVDNARTELGTQQVSVGGTAYNVTGTTTPKTLMESINAAGGDFTASIENGELRIRNNDEAANFAVTATDVTVKKGTTPAAANATLTAGDTLEKKTSFNEMLGFDRGSKITITADMTAEDLRVALSAIEGVTADFNDKGNLIVYGEQGDDFIISDKSGTPAALTGLLGTATNGNNARATYSKQFDGIMAQIDQLVNDTSYKGINLLKGDNLTVNFNETRTSQLEIKGVTLDSKGIGMTVADNEWKTNANIDKTLTQIEKATSVLRAQASEFGQNLATVQVREDFTNNMINNLVSGSDKLTLADMNEEAANILALQTRQQLATNSLSMASQSAQGVLRLF